MKKTREELEAELARTLARQAGEQIEPPSPADAPPAGPEQEASSPAPAQQPGPEQSFEAPPDAADQAVGEAAPVLGQTPSRPPPPVDEEEGEILPALLEKLPPAVEALLFALAEPVTTQQLVGTLRKVHPRLNSRTLRRVLETLRDRLAGDGRGIRLQEVAGGWQLRTAEEFIPYLRHLNTSRPPRMSRATLETLAVVAYRQPVTRGEIENIRGVDCGAVLRGLLEKKLVRILGRKDEPGRPLIYGTSREFLSFFSLRDLASLPTLRDFAELSEEAREQLGVSAPASRAEENRGEQEPPQPLDEEQQAAYTPVGNDEIIQELDQALDEIRKRDLRLRREVLPPPPPPAAGAPAPDGQVQAPADSAALPPPEPAASKEQE